ncbi:hypothetical protein ACE38V_05590 [Cytobacillus sp. Hz8]|uniref:hypothetical protein n=1 Tax=Cytobacillus sp. Hz8 TaxID=3347168 RepID=UPI0035DBB13F
MDRNQGKEEKESIRVPFMDRIAGKGRKGVPKRTVNRQKSRKMTKKESKQIQTSKMDSAATESETSPIRTVYIIPKANKPNSKSPSMKSM